MQGPKLASWKVNRERSYQQTNRIHINRTVGRLHFYFRSAGSRSEGGRLFRQVRNQGFVFRENNRLQHLELGAGQHRHRRHRKLLGCARWSSFFPTDLALALFFIHGRGYYSFFFILGVPSHASLSHAGLGILRAVIQLVMTPRVPKWAQSTLTSKSEICTLARSKIFMCIICPLPLLKERDRASS